VFWIIVARSIVSLFGRFGENWAPSIVSVNEFVSCAWWSYPTTLWPSFDKLQPCKPHQLYRIWNRL